MYGQLHNYRQERGTVLILCVALLVMLGLIASSFVILSHAHRRSARSLTRADQIQQVRQMSLEYVRTLLLEDLVGNDGKFLNADANDEAYDAPAVDTWLSLHAQTDTPGPTHADTDNDGDQDTAWGNVSSQSLPSWLTSITAPDGTKYQIAIRIVDTNALANINIGAADISDPAWPEPNVRLWDSQYPCYLDLSEIGAGAFLDDGDGVSIAGRIPDQSTDRFTALTSELYPHLANTNYTDLNALGLAYIRPFDAAEELALRMMAGPGTDLSGRLGGLLAAFSTNSDFLTSYSWTMQIRPPTSGANAIDTDLETLGYPAPSKVSLVELVDPADDMTEDKSACTAVYLGLLAAGMQANDAAQFMVNLIDYIDSDDQIRFIDHVSSTSDVIDFSLLTDAVLHPTNTYYGTDNQPIISEVYSYRYYDAVWNAVNLNYDYTPNATEHRYAVELYNPTSQDINLSGWKLEVVGRGTWPLPNESILAGEFLTLVSHYDIVTSGAEGEVAGLIIRDTAASTETIKLRRPDPSGSVDVAVDRFEGDVQADLISGSTDPGELFEDAERPGRTIPSVAGNIPVIAPFGAIVTTNTNSLGTFPTATMATAGEGGQVVLRNDGEFHSLGELLYVPTVANTASGVELILAMETSTANDSAYRLQPTASGVSASVLRNLTLRTGLKDNADNNGDGYSDNVKISGGTPSATPEQIIAEARVPGLININTAPDAVLQALHYYYVPSASVTYDLPVFVQGSWPFRSMADVAYKFAVLGSVPVVNSEDESLPADGGSADGIAVDNEQKLFHFKNIANLISVRSDVFVVYITIQASDRDGNFDPPATTTTLRTMAIVDRSWCLRPATTSFEDVPLPRIIAQTTLP